MTKKLQHILCKENRYTKSNRKRRLRVRPPLYVTIGSVCYGQDDPLLRAISNFNETSHLFNFNVCSVQFHTSLRTPNQ